MGTPAAASRSRSAGAGALDVDQDQLVAGAGQQGGDAAEALDHRGAGEERRDDADGAGPSRREGAGGGVGLVAELGDDLEDAAARGLADGSGSVDDA
jgi:hypothetical protein